MEMPPEMWQHTSGIGDEDMANIGQLAERAGLDMDDLLTMARAEKRTVEAILEELTGEKPTLDAPKPESNGKANGKGKGASKPRYATGVSIEDTYGDDAKAEMRDGVLVLLLTLPTSGKLSASGRSTVHQSFNIKLSDGSRITGSRYTPLPKA